MGRTRVHPIGSGQSSRQSTIVGAARSRQGPTGSVLAACCCRRGVGRHLDADPEPVGCRNCGAVHRKGQGYRRSRVGVVAGRVVAGHKVPVGRRTAVGHKKVAVHKRTAGDMDHEIRKVVAVGVHKMAVVGHKMVVAGEEAAGCMSPGWSTDRHSWPVGCLGGILRIILSDWLD